MLSVEDRYYKIIRILLKMLGIWPFRNSKWADIRAVIITTLYLSVIFVQLAVFITHKCTLDLMLETLSLVFPNILILIMYDSYYFKSDVMREIMEHMYHDWRTLKDKMEFNIMNDYATTIKHFAEIFLCLICVGIFISAAFNLILTVLDFVSPVNESRAHVHVRVEYFIDPQKYSYLLLLHLTFSLSLGIISIMAIGLAYLSYGFHACAMFKVANYRMKIAMDKNVLRIPSPVKEHIIHERIVSAVNAHRRAIQYCNQLTLTLANIILFALAVGVTSLSINLFRLLKVITTFTEIIDSAIPVVVVSIHFFFLFFGNHMGQQIVNNNAEIFNTVYDLPWYVAPLNIRRMLLFLLQNSYKNIYISISGIFDASYEGFATLTRLSISYFTVLYAIQ